MRFKTPNIDVEVSYKKAENKLMVQTPKIVTRANGADVSLFRIVQDKKYLWKGKEVEANVKFRDPETGMEVSSSEVLEVLQKYRYAHINMHGETVDPRDIQYYALQPDGTEVEVEPFSRTTVIEIPEQNWVPAANIGDFIYTSVYELMPKMKKGQVVSKKDLIALWKEAELRWKKDQVGITTFSWGNGFIQYYAFVSPIIKEGKFGWTMKLTNTQVAYNYLQPIPEKVEIKELPTLKTLPPVQALIAVAK